jgi:NADPH:quinone reductase-like Zn-dependent oxidoreductase
MTLKPQEIQEIVKTTESMIKSELKTEVQAKYGFHQIEEAIQFYLKNQTAGKILLKPNLTKDQSPKL